MSMRFGLGFARPGQHAANVVSIAVGSVLPAVRHGYSRSRSRLATNSCIVALWGLLILLVPTWAFAERCGATERWFVKVGTDPRASEVDVDHPIPITVAGLNALPKLQGTVPKGDNKFRLDEETKVYKVSGHLALFKDEDDDDYHLVITDESLNYTPGGPGSDGRETGTSFIAEIAHPDCVAGKKGPLGVPSQFQAALESTHADFEARFPQGKGADQLQGIPVTLTGVAFYDRPHHQTGRAVNGIELHPVLAISFDGAPVQPLSTPATQLLANGGFEEGVSPWSGSVRTIGAYVDTPAHGGEQVCWLGGYGRKKSESIAQTITIPATAASATLGFWIDLSTQEVTTSKAYDKCVVQLRSSSGQVLSTLETLSNLNETGGFLRKSYDLTAYKGREVQIYVKASEDAERATSFILDDFSLEVR